MPSHVALGALGLTVGGLLLATLLWRWPRVMTIALVLYSTLILLRGPALQPQYVIFLRDHTGPTLAPRTCRYQPGVELAGAAGCAGPRTPMHRSGSTVVAYSLSFSPAAIAKCWAWQTDSGRTPARGTFAPWPSGPARTGRICWDFATSSPPADVEGRPTDDAVERYRDDTVRIYEITTALPRAWLVSNVRLVAPEQAEEILYTLNTEAVKPSRRTALVEASPYAKRIAGELAAAESRTYQPGMAQILHATLGSVEIRTASSMPALLITSDEFNPGWAVSVDGKPATPLRANYLLRGVLVPAGEHLGAVGSITPATCNRCCW